MASSTDAQIRSKLNQANQLQSQINAYRGQYNAALGKKRKYEQRLRQVQSVKNNVGGRLNSYAETARTREGKVRSSLEGALTGVSAFSNVVYQVSSSVEKRTEEDARGRNVHDSLQQEINRCQREIAQAQSEMDRSQRAIDSANAQRSACISQAKSLSGKSDATIKVRVR